MENECHDPGKLGEKEEINPLQRKNERDVDGAHSGIILTTAKKIFLPEESNTQLKELRKKFPELGKSEAKRIDEEMKAYLMVCPVLVKEKILDYLIQKLKAVGISIESGDINYELASEQADIYARNESEGALNEGWACFLGFIVTNILMIISTFELSALYNALAGAFSCLMILLVWLIAVCHTSINSRKTKIFLDTFNQTVTLFTLLDMIVFYAFYNLAIAYACPRILAAVIPLGASIFYFGVSMKWYRLCRKSYEESLGDEE